MLPANCPYSQDPHQCKPFHEAPHNPSSTAGPRPLCWGRFLEYSSPQLVLLVPDRAPESNTIQLKKKPPPPPSVSNHVASELHHIFKCLLWHYGMPPFQQTAKGDGRGGLADVIVHCHSTSQTMCLILFQQRYVKSRGKSRKKSQKRDQ